MGLLGEICHCTGGGGVPHELLELVLRRWPGGGAPMVNWTAGGDIWQMSGIGGAENRRVLALLLAPGIGLAFGVRGLDAGLPIRVCLAFPPPIGAILSSGKGPRVDPPLAELTPDMADTESPLRLRDLEIEIQVLNRIVIYEMSF